MLLHRRSRAIRALALLVVSALLSACGGDDIMGTGDGPDPVSDPILTGTLLDGPTGGVTFTSGSQSGVTNAQGEFRYRLGEFVNFSVGGIDLGTVSGATIITPVELTGSADPSNQRVRNMLVFLQSIDEDQDHSNGISINAVGRSNAANARLDFSSANFAADVAAAVAQITGGANSIVSEQQALDNFYATYVSIGGTASVSFPFPGYPPVGGPTVAAVPVDFEGGFTYQFSNFGGGEAVVIDNPQANGINTSARVAQMVKAAGEVFGGTTLTLDTPVDFSQGEVFTMKVWASREVPVLFKLEATQATFVELTATHSGSGEWEELTFDFSGTTSGLGDSLVNIVLIFDNGIMGNAAGNLADWLFYFDDIAQSSDTGGGGGSSGSVVVTDQAPLDFEDATASYTFNDFGGGVASIIDNPQTTGNSSAKVGRMQKFAGDVFGGSTLVLDAPVDFSAGEVFTMAVYSEAVSALTFKLEGLNVERVVNTTGTGWETMTFDFTGATTGAAVTGITLIFDNGTAGDAANDPSRWTFLFDDLQLTAGGGTGGGGGAVLPFSDDFESGDLAGWTATPNGGSITADNTQAGGGTYSARLVAGPTHAPAFSIEGLAAGTVSAGDTIDVSWDMCGSFAGGGEVMFAALLSEPGGEAGAVRVFDTIPTVPAVWTRFTRSFTADADPNNVLGGISVQFDVVCGGDAGCAADVFIDNVTITNGAGDTGGPASGASCATGGGGTGGATGVSGSVFFDSVHSQWDGSSLSAFDQAIGFGSCTDDGGAACPSIGWSVVAAADTARGDVIEVTYSGDQFAGLVIGQPAAPLDFTEFAGGSIVFDLNVTANPNSAPFVMKVDCAGCPTDGGQREQSLGVPGTGWQTFTVPVADLVNANGGPTAGGLKIDQVTTGLVVFPAFGQTSGVAYQIDNVRWERAGAVFEEVVANQWDASSLSAFDQAIGFASCTDDGGAACPSIAWSVVAAADTARGDVIDVTYSGDQFAGIVIGQPATPLDFSQFAGGNIVFDLNVTANPNSAPFVMKVDCTGCPTDGGQREQSLGVPGAGWQTFTVPVDDLVNANGGPTAGGLKIDQVTTGLVVFPAFGQTAGVSYQIDNVRWEAATGGGTGGGGGTGTNLAVNGDFETGDLSGWELFPGGGSITVDGTQNNGGAFSGKLVATGSTTAGQDVIFKQANLAVGTVNPGDTINISFDLFGSLAGAGGVVFAEFFSELTGGGVSGQEILGGAPLTPTGTWTTHSFTATAGADVSGGITLQLKAGCGAVDGCVVEAYFDNVSISIQ